MKEIEIVPGKIGNGQNPREVFSQVKIDGVLIPDNILVTSSRDDEPTNVEQFKDMIRYQEEVIKRAKKSAGK